MDKCFFLVIKVLFRRQHAISTGIIATSKCLAALLNYIFGYIADNSVKTLVATETLLVACGPQEIPKRAA